MLKGRTLHTTKIKDHPDLSVYGIFDTQKVHWEFYVISHNGSNLTPELCIVSGAINNDRIRKFGKKVSNKQEGISFITEYHRNEIFLRYLDPQISFHCMY